MRRKGWLFASLMGTALLTATAAIALADAAAYGSACPLSSAGKEGVCVEFPNLDAEFGIGVVPNRLSRHERTPVAVKLWGKVATTDGSHPSALREMTIDVDRNVAIDAKGLPVCRPGMRDFRQPSGTLRKACRGATVGRGKADFEITFPEQPPAVERSPLTIYNGGVVGGVTTLYAVASINLAVPQAIVTQIKIAKIRKGPYGLRAVAKLPLIAGGSGSLLGFRLKIGRLFGYKRRQKSYVTARCPNGELKVEFPNVLFRNDARTPGVPSRTILKGAISRPCTSRP
jgi:hypothetical protein